MQQLVWAQNIVEHTNKPVLIATPLAVGPQTVDEASKFGMSATVSRDGTPKGKLTVTNYQMLHRFNPNDFAGFVGDECFPKGTLIDTPSGQYAIENIQVGDKITNCVGVDIVSDVHRREVFYAVKIKLDGKAAIIASPNHPVFTGRGWVSSQDIEPGDSILQTKAAMRMVQYGVSPSSASRECDGEVLREILLSEMANEAARTSSQGLHKGTTREGDCRKREVVGVGVSVCCGSKEENCRTESNGKSNCERKGEPHIESHEAQTFRAWRKRKGNDHSSEDITGCSWRWVGSRVCLVVGETGSSLSNALQNGLSSSRAKSMYRGGWSVSQINRKKGAGFTEGSDSDFVRVDSIEILERGHPELEQFRNAEGKLYFYDLGATQHPSYSVNGLLVHNSSCIKDDKSKTKSEVEEFTRRMPYRLLCTATAAPNDYHELGTSSEVLGLLGYRDMITTFFKMEQAGGHTGWARIKYRFREHAKLAFWRWTCSWSRACRKPSDLGFSDEGYELPPLIIQHEVVGRQNRQKGRLFNVPAYTLPEQLEERRATIPERCQRVAELVSGKDRSVSWCDLNPEGDMLAKLIKGSQQISGRDSDESKEKKLLGFSDGSIQHLIIKDVIGAYGLNWQHCNYTTRFVSNSFERTYQAIHRFHRFGQKRPVTVGFVSTDGDAKVVANYERKSRQADEMFSSIVAEMNNAVRINPDDIFSEEEIFPTWL